MSNEWIESNGTRVVPVDMIVNVRYRMQDGDVRSVRADHVRWGDVVKYQIADRAGWLHRDDTFALKPGDAERRVDVVTLSGVQQSSRSQNSDLWPTVGWWRYSGTPAQPVPPAPAPQFDASGPWYEWMVGDAVPEGFSAVRLRDGDCFVAGEQHLDWNECGSRTIAAYRLDASAELQAAHDKVILLETLLESERKRHAEKMNDVGKKVIELSAENSVLRTFARKAAAELQRHNRMLTDIQMAAFNGNLPLSVFEDARAVAAAYE